MKASTVLRAAVAMVGCAGEPANTATHQATPPTGGSGAADAAWLLAGSPDERFARVAKHLRGFDVAMVEVGYRYTELYWAGRDRNWAYAEYQLGKIETAVANGVERRPRRASSAQMLEPAVRHVRSAIGLGNETAFDTAFTELTSTCNRCHQAEGVAFVTVRSPTERGSPVRPDP